MVRYGFALLALLVAGSAVAEKIGSVDTTFHLIGNNATIDVNAFDDPKIPGVSCYLASAQTGGLKATVGLATDTSDASVTCHKTGVIQVPANLKSGESASHPKQIF